MDEKQTIERVLNQIISKNECSVAIANWLEVKLDEKFPDDCEIQEFVTELALYNPNGGEYLVNENQLIKRSKEISNYIANISNLCN